MLVKLIRLQLMINLGNLKMSLDVSEEFTTLWTKAQPMIGGYISSMVFDYHGAQDVLQKTAIILIRKFEKYDRSLPFLPWALGVARYEILKHRSKSAKDKCVFSDEMVKISSERFAEVAKDHDDLSIALDQCLKRLTDRGQRVLRLRYTQGLKSDEIAEQLGVTGSAVRVMLHRVRGAVRGCIEERMSSENHGGVV